MWRLMRQILGLQDMDVFEVTDAEKREGIGRIGNLEYEMTVGECCELVKRAFHLSTVKLFGNKDAIVKCAAISPGSGKKMTEIAVEKGADVLITGDIDHHEGIDAVAQGLAVIDAGHYGLEHIFIEDMAKYLEEHVEGVQVEKAGISHPFQVI